MNSQFSDMISSWTFFDIALFLLLNLVTGSSFRLISSLALELWQYSYTRDWTEIRKLQITLSEFCPISGDWGELGIQNLAQTSLIKSYYVTFTVLELLRENQQGGWGGWVVELPPPPPPTPDKVNTKQAEIFEDKRSKFLKQVSLAYSCMVYQSLWYRATDS